MKGALVKAGLTTACAVACTAVGPSAAFAVTVDFNYTGETQQWVVPEGVTSATFDLHGAAGGAAQPGLEGPCQGGWGAHVQATLPVTPGQVVQIEVGDKGSSQLEGGTGYNGGGAPGASWSGGGGGASDVRTSAELADRLLVAGGGGGCGYDSFGGGHSGGAGSDGRDVLAYNGEEWVVVATGGRGGQPGTQEAGGAGGAGGQPGGQDGQAGALGVGGTGGGTETTFGGPGGGGGGGYYGGGGGGNGASYFDGTVLDNAGGGGGGGGSSFAVPAASAVSVVDGVRQGPGLVSVTYEDLTPPPAPDLQVTQPPSPSNDNQVEVIGSAEAGSTVKLYLTSDCSGDPAASGTAEQLQGPGITVTVADDSVNQIRATATDESTNESPCSEPIEYVEDSIPPQTTLTAGPPDVSESDEASFEFIADESASFECNLDDGGYEPCTSPKDYSGLAPGPHTFAVHAIDAAGNADPAPATFGWTVAEAEPPDTLITSGPKRKIKTRKRRVRVRFEFTGTDNVSAPAALTFQCQLDSRPKAACTSPFSARVKRGKHVFRVWATDEAGHEDPEPAVRRFRVVRRR